MDIRFTLRQRADTGICFSFDSLGRSVDTTQSEMTLMDYDAFVIYNPVGDDLHFVKLLVSVMEAPPYSLKLFVPWRDHAREDHYVSADLIQNK